MEVHRKQVLVADDIELRCENSTIWIDSASQPCGEERGPADGRPVNTGSPTCNHLMACSFNRVQRMRSENTASLTFRQWRQGAGFVCQLQPLRPALRLSGSTGREGHTAPGCPEPLPPETFMLQAASGQEQQRHSGYGQGLHCSGPPVSWQVRQQPSRS